LFADSRTGGYENATVKLEFVVDARGLPEHVDTLGLVSTEGENW